MAYLDYDDSLLQELQSGVDLLEYAKKTYNFKQTGADSWATNCPLHPDPNPSLKITPSKNLYHCFSCGVGGGIISWLIRIEHMDFNSAVDKLGGLTNTDVNSLKISPIMKYYRSIQRIMMPKEKKVSERKILPLSGINAFSDLPPTEWLDEGIEQEVLEKYQVKVDEASNRIVYPVWDNEDNLIGFKGRTRYKNYKEMKIQKYMNYNKIGTTNFFVGMHENRQNIIKAGEAIIFEGIKSGMKVEGWGYKNWLASETAALNKDQVIILIKLGISNVVIAWDNDITLKKVRASVRELKQFVNVYMIQDRTGMLGSPEDKVSPPDKGRDVWEELYKNKVRIN